VKGGKNQMEKWDATLYKNFIQFIKKIDGHSLPAIHRRLPLRL